MAVQNGGVKEEKAAVTATVKLQHLTANFSPIYLTMQRYFLGKHMFEKEHITRTHHVGRSGTWRARLASDSLGPGFLAAALVCLQSWWRLQARQG